jgi:hypothetical protein
MNIFKILGSGANKLKETNVSAFLGYLLNPYADHGLGSSFLELFLEPLIHQYQENLKAISYDLSSNLFDVEVAYEKGVNNVEGNDGTSIIDIVIKISKKTETNKRSLISMFQNYEPLALILIENKISSGSFTKSQIIEQYERAIKFLDNQFKENKDQKILNKYKERCFSIYVTPSGEKFSDEIVEFSKDGMKGLLINWNNTEGYSPSVVLMLENLLKEENAGAIQPIEEYTKHTIKAFINFIKSDFKSEVEEKIEGKGIPKYFNNIEESLKYQSEDKNMPSFIVNLAKVVDKKILEVFTSIGIQYTPTHAASYFLDKECKSKFASMDLGKREISLKIYTEKTGTGRKNDSYPIKTENDISEKMINMITRIYPSLKK